MGAVMIIVIMGVVMIGATMRVVGTVGVTAPLPPSWMFAARYARFMDHPASDCWWCHGDDMDDEIDHNDKKVHAAAYGINTNWYTDTCTTDHIPGR
jgi:hypothetical protein